MSTFCSHTLVRNGMPFLDLVLRQVIPFMNRCLVTISEKSTDGTWQTLDKLVKEFPKKVFVETEDVQNYSDLTFERQKMVEKTTEDWILFLDDDDYWSTEALQSFLTVLNDKNDGYAFNPFQLLPKRMYCDASWIGKKWFTKWFRNQPGLHYQNPWPRDMIYVNNKSLYWKYNSNVPLSRIPFFHLALLKYQSFRNESWAAAYTYPKGVPSLLLQKYKDDVEKIYNCL